MRVPRNARRSLCALAVVASATAVLSDAGAANAATRRFGSPAATHSTTSFGGPRPGTYTAGQAVTQLHAIAAATRAAGAGGALITGSQASSEVSGALTVAIGTSAARIQVTGPLSFLAYQSTSMRYAQLDRTNPEVLAALALLHASGATYSSMPSTDPLISPADIVEELYASDAPALRSMVRSDFRGLVRYQVTFTVPAPERGFVRDVVTVVTDRSDRLTAYSAAISGSGDGETYNVRYGPQTVTLPDPQQVVDETQLERAVVSRHLPQALASFAQEAFFNQISSNGPSGVTVAQFRAAARALATSSDNGMGGIAVTVTDVPNGVSLTAHNPFTGATVTVRATLNAYGWVSVTDTAGHPIDPDGFDGISALTSSLRGAAAVSRAVAR